MPAAIPHRTPITAVKVDHLDADQLDGRDASYLLLTAGKAADADKLHGLDSTQLVVGDPARDGQLIAIRQTGLRADRA